MHSSPSRYTTPLNTSLHKPTTTTLTDTSLTPPYLPTLHPLHLPTHLPTQSTYYHTIGYLYNTSLPPTLYPYTSLHNLTNTTLSDTYITPPYPYPIPPTPPYTEYLVLMGTILTASCTHHVFALHVMYILHLYYTYIPCIFI